MLLGINAFDVHLKPGGESMYFEMMMMMMIMSVLLNVTFITDV